MSLAHEKENIQISATWFLNEPNGKIIWSSKSVVNKFYIFECIMSI